MDHYTIQLPDFLSVIQVTNQLLEHSTIEQLLAIQLLDVSITECLLYQVSCGFKDLPGIHGKGLP